MDKVNVTFPLLELLREVLGERHPNTLIAMNNLANVLQDLGELSEAREKYKQVLELRREVRGERHPNTLISMNNLASVLRDLGELSEARSMYELGAGATSGSFR